MLPNRVELVPLTRDDLLAMIDAMSSADREQVSPDWLARVQAAEELDPWAFGFAVALWKGGARIGSCGFKGPPSEGVVEIAYVIDEAYRGRGYATEAAQAITDFAFKHPEVETVRAHTLPEPNASTRVLTKCGFRYLGEVTDPEDGRVWRWEKTRTA